MSAATAYVADAVTATCADRGVTVEQAAERAGIERPQRFARQVADDSGAITFTDLDALAAWLEVDIPMWFPGA